MHMNASCQRPSKLRSWSRVGLLVPLHFGRPTHVSARHALRCARGLEVPDAAPDAAPKPATPQQALPARPPARLPPELQSERFEAMFSQLLEWKEKYYNCLVPRQAFDAQELGEWVHRLRRLRAQGRVPEGLVIRLNRVGFAWTVDNITAKWYHNLHVARRYKALHGTAEIPPDYSDHSEPDFVEAGRWLARQRDLYARQKLLLIRVRQMKESLGIKFEREYAPVRRNLHPVIRSENAKFQRELERRAQRAEQAAGGQQAQQQGQQQGSRKKQGAAGRGRGGGRGGSLGQRRARQAEGGGQRQRSQQQPQQQAQKGGEGASAVKLPSEGGEGAS